MMGFAAFVAFGSWCKMGVNLSLLDSLVWDGLFAFMRIILCLLLWEKCRRRQIRRVFLLKRLLSC